MTKLSDSLIEGNVQNDYMQSDQCIQVDINDVEIGPISKYRSHQFSSDPDARDCPLHRAFSAFIFNENDELLLQQRAKEKITFPNVWSNTCCSHPLYGFEKNEVDSAESIKQGTVTGIKYAAQRKIANELGIMESDIPIASMKYLTRVHYIAKDEITYGKNAVWGEHEIDYILFIRVKNSIHVIPNPEEVSNTKWVNQSQFRSMIAPSSGLLWSPWFRIIADKLLFRWWDDLNGAFNTDRHNEYAAIHRFV
jgi:isopentenyl-diphosphate delta-isomerase type 1